jgi:hypothetical protein
MKVYTNIKILKRAWSILKELELEGLLSGGKVKVDFMKVVDELLDNGKLNEFCQAITKTDIDFEEMELNEITGIAADFFTGIGSAFKTFQNQITVAVPEQE